MSYHHTISRPTALHRMQSAQIAHLLGIPVEQALRFPERKTKLNEITRLWKPQEQAQYILNRYFDVQISGIDCYGDDYAGFRQKERTEFLHTLTRRIHPLLKIACGRLDYENSKPEALWTALRGECESLWSIVDSLRYPAAWHHDTRNVSLMHWHSLWGQIGNIADAPKRDRYGIACEAETSRKEIYGDLYCRAEQLGFLIHKRSLIDRLADTLRQRSTVLRWTEGSQEDPKTRNVRGETP